MVNYKTNINRKSSDPQVNLVRNTKMGDDIEMGNHRGTERVPIGRCL